MPGISCQSEECDGNIASAIRKLRAAEERIKWYRLAALELCGGDKEKLKVALAAAEDKL